MLKQVLIIMLGVFFLLNGFNHLFNTQMLKEYAKAKHLFEPKLMVLISGVALILGGVSLISGLLIEVGLIGLSVFLLLAALLLHQFWREKTKDKRLGEGLQFAKNIVIIIELLYILEGKLIAH